MTTLHKVANATKKIAIGFCIGILSIIFFSLTAKLFVNIKEKLYPTPLPAPTVSFGTLPSIPFPTSSITTALTYSLNTASGSLPTFDDRVTVYKIHQPQASFSSLTEAKALATTNGFSNDPIALNDLLYQWKATNFFDETLTMNILSFDFSLDSNYLTNNTVAAATNLGNPETATSKAKDFISGFASGFPADIDDTKTQTSFIAITNGTLTPATSLANAQAIRVDYYQADIDKHPLFYPHYPQSLLEIFVASSDTAPQVAQATFTHRIIDTASAATYPIKTVQQAFDELQSGKGYVANYDTPNKTVVIRNVVLGYYISEKDQAYLLPIIVFEGDNNFYGYVPAITDSWVQK
jgi:hypothetical protein